MRRQEIAIQNNEVGDGHQVSIFKSGATARNIDPTKIVIPHGRFIKELIKRNLDHIEGKGQKPRLQIDPNDLENLRHLS